MRRPMFVLALALCAGACVGQSVPADALGRILAGSALLVVLALAGARAPLAGPALLAAALGLAAALASLERAEYERAPLRAFVRALEAGGEPAPVELLGRSVDDALPDARRTRLLLDVEELSAGGRTLGLRGRVRVEVGGSAGLPVVLAGDRVRVWASLRLPRGFATPGAPDAERRAFEQALLAEGYCKSAQLVGVAPGAGLLARGRHAARRRLQAHVLPGNEQALVRAMLLGDRSALDDASLEAFRAAGTLHVLAISGAQVALLAALLVAALRASGAAPLVAALLVSVTLLAYAAFVGGDVPVARATIGALIVVWGRTLDLDADWLNLIGAAAALLLLERPSAVSDAGFQLSFGATVGVLALTARLRGARRWPLQLDALLAASLSAQAAVAPIQAARFGRLPLAGLLLNLAAVPLSTGVLLGGLAVLVASSLGETCGDLAGNLAWCLARALLHVSGLADGWPSLDRHVAVPPWWAFALHLAALVALARGSLRRRDLLAWAAAAAGMLWSAPSLADGRVHLELLDVGQSECLVLTSPRGRIFMVDAAGALGERYDLARSVVAPYLWSRGIARIEVLAISHAHPDHAGGLRYLLEHFDVGQVWEGPAAPFDSGYRELLAAPAARARRVAVARGMHANWDGLEVDVLGPRAPARPAWKVRNDDSLVLGFTFGRRRFLLTGDVESDGERALPAWPADVLKVAHHGSRSSSSPGFLAAVGARLALVSAGYRNRFGHPHPEVLARHRAQGTVCLRTDLDGSLRVSSDGRRLWMESARSGLRLPSPPRLRVNIPRPPGRGE